MHEFPASPMQIAVSTADSSGKVANTQVSINFGETVDISLLRQAWEWLSNYHGLLRSSFKRSNTKSHLTLREYTDYGLPWYSLDWTKVPHEEIAVKWKQFQLADAAKSIDLSAPPLYRFHIIALPDRMHHFLWTFHSILFDEESVSLILKDWLRIYNSLCKRERLPVAQGALSYAAVIGAIEGTDPESIKKYWEDTFRDFSSWCPLRPLYLGKTTPPSVLPASYTEFLDRETTLHLRQLISLENNDTSPFLTLLTAVWGLVLARTNIEGDAIFGIYRSCRSLGGPQAKETVGLFDTLLPIRIKVPENLSCKAWLDRLHKDELALAPFLLTNAGEIWHHLRGADSSPRFDSTLHYIPTSINDRISSKMPEWMRFDARLQETLSVPIRIIARGEERLSITLEYNAHQITPTLARQLFDRLLKGIQSFEKDPHTVLSKISLILPHETEELLAMGNSSLRAPTPHLFFSLEESTKQHADLPAVEKEGKSFSFSFIEKHSQQLAAFLKSHSQQPEVVIALAMAPSAQMLVGLLGILKAGCICLPLNPNAQPAYLEKLFKRYKVAAVLTDNQQIHTFSKIGLPSFLLDEIWTEITALPSDLPLSLPPPSAPALLLSQARGERLLVSHEMLQISLENAARTYRTKPTHRLLCHSLPGSAASIEECLIPLLTGATLVIPEKNVKNTRTTFQEAIDSGKITHLRLTSAFWSQWVHYLHELGHGAPPQLQRILIESGHISPPIIQSWKQLNKQGTECVVFFSPSGFLGIGLATEATETPDLLEEGLVCGQTQPGTIAFLSDHQHRLVPSFFPGILFTWLGTPQIQPLHDKNVITLPGDPNLRKNAQELARWNEKRQLVLISQPHTSLPSGLTWKQLRRIEDVLASHPELIDAIVRKSSPEENSPSSLCAWIVPRDSHSQIPATLGSYLKEHLPKDEIPTQFALVTRFSLNAFDQIESKLLPKPAPLPQRHISSLTTPQNTSHTSLISTLRASHEGLALYFIHAGRGLVEDYRPIAHALPTQYGVHCIMIPRKQSTFSATVEEITSQLIPAIRLHASGKFAIVGIGTGAVFAWEIARQLDKKSEQLIPIILFEIPSAGQKETFSWFNKIKASFFRNEKEYYSPQGRFAELLATYEPPILHRKFHFFMRGKPHPDWYRRAPVGVWKNLSITQNSLLEAPETIASALKDVFSSSTGEKSFYIEKINA